jgi:23S rRNA pseudouridine1911/1915/1917 synthase
MFGEKRKYIVPESLAGQRVDKVLSEIESSLSRQYIQKLIKEKVISIDGKPLKASFKVSGNERIIIDFPAPQKMELEAVNIPLDIVYDDEYLLIINKPAGMVVHPADNGKYMDSSLVNAVLSRVGDGLKGIGGVLRPGIVHRLDKDTSGLIVVAKTDLAHQKLSDMFKDRKVEKHYLALVTGNIKEDRGQIILPIGRHPSQRKKMVVDGLNAREAKTEFEVVKRFKTRAAGDFTLLDVRLHTGRTHQIRVHFQSIRHPLVGDLTYGIDKTNNWFEEKFGLRRQFLHAFKLEFVHPITKKRISLKIDLPSDLIKITEELEKY